MTAPNISVVVLSHSRQENLPAIVKSLLVVPRFDDIVVWHNDPSQPLDVLGDGGGRVTVHNARENYCTLGRFMAAKLCRHDVIATQDDDVLIGSWRGVLASFDEYPDRITAGMPDGHRRLHSRLQWGDAHEVLFGWGAVFDRRWIALTLKPYIDQYGTDEVLKRKADRLFSILLNRRHRIAEAWFAKLPGADAPAALYRQRDHRKLTQVARERAMGLLGLELTEARR